MQLNKETLQNIAHLARLDFDENTEEAMLKDMNKILEWMQKLDELDTTDVTPLIHISEEINVLRDDEALPSLPHDQGLLNAPNKDSNYFRVPKVID